MHDTTQHEQSAYSLVDGAVWENGAQSAREVGGRSGVVDVLPLVVREPVELVRGAIRHHHHVHAIEEDALEAEGEHTPLRVEREVRQVHRAARLSHEMVGMWFHNNII